MSRPSTMRHQFSRVPSVEIPRSNFERSHGIKTTFDAGQLVPILVDEILPGDTFNCRLTAFARMATPIYPIMDNLFMETFFFFVPNRLVWDNWQKFCGEQVDPGDSIDYTIPTIATNAAGHDNMTIFDYMGIPTKVTSSFDVCALPFRAYNLIWNEWFRDQNLQDSLTVSKADADEGHATYEIQKRGKRHDYFTSCLPWLQKGDAVTLSLGTEAPITHHTSLSTTYMMARKVSDDAYIDPSDDSSVEIDGQYSMIQEQESNIPLYFHLDDRYYADLENATASTVNELRQAIQIQRVLERDARAGTRYTEIVRSHFGVESPDSRLQRPEYLGGGTSRVNVNPIARTEGAPGSGTGELGAMATAGFDGHGFVKSFTEHGWLIGLVCVRADLTYQEGLNRMWSRETRYDVYWPSFAHIGEQAVLNKEIYLDGSANDELVFGYQERYAEMRYKPSLITGDFRSNDGTSLDPWHLSIEFGSLPTLDDTFIEENPPVDRVIATPADPHFLFDGYFKLNCARPMPLYSVPGFIDHF